MKELIISEENSRVYEELEGIKNSVIRLRKSLDFEGTESDYNWEIGLELEEVEDKIWHLIRKLEK